MIACQEYNLNWNNFYLNIWSQADKTIVQIEKGKVALISGGGSGHEPFCAGYIGETSIHDGGYIYFIYDLKPFPLFRRWDADRRGGWVCLCIASYMLVLLSILSFLCFYVFFHMFFLSSFHIGRDQSSGKGQPRFAAFFSRKSLEGK